MVDCVFPPPLLPRPRMTLLRPERYDDTSGALSLNVVIVLAFFALFWLNIADLMEVIRGDEEDAMVPPPFALPPYAPPP